MTPPRPVMPSPNEPLVVSVEIQRGPILTVLWLPPEMRSSSLAVSSRTAVSQLLIMLSMSALGAASLSACAQNRGAQIQDRDRHHAARDWYFDPVYAEGASASRS